MATVAIQRPQPSAAEAPAQAATQPSIAAEQDDFQSTIDILKQKYREERDKRLAKRPEGNSQYKDFQGIFANYLKDPYTPLVERDPMDIEIDFLVIGGGFGGLCTAAHLVEAGITNTRIMDKAGDFGGTWYWNRYPGGACDIESYCYMPLLEETGYIPTEKYAKAPELQEHSRRIARKYNLYERAIFHTEAQSMTWDEKASRWIIKTDRGDTIRSRFFATASGPLTKPKLPGVEGIEKFKGHYFHTSRWDYEYTGGSIRGNLDKIGDKKIGIIGTGATAIQAVPHLGQGAGHLYVFQRTPSSVGWRNNRPTDPEWAKSLKPGWQAQRQENFLSVMYGDQDKEDLVDDGWTAATQWMKKQGLKGDRRALYTQHAQKLEEADFQNMERIRKRCEDVVQDRKTAEALKPWYRQWCKRPCFHDEYLDTFNRPNVTLVDTDGQGIERITEKGVVVNGKEIELDCIIYSTGFEVGTAYERRSNFKIHGRNGITLTDAWADGPRTLHGFHCRDFPNMFIVSTLHSGLAANFVHMLSRQGKWVAAMLKTFKEKNVKVAEAQPEAVEAWTAEIADNQWKSVAAQRECTPGYYNREGDLEDNLRTKRSGSYAQGPLAFCKLMDEWVASGDLKGLELTVDDKAWA